MAIYYFDIREGDALAVDDEGLELASLEAVRQEAVRSVSDLARDAARDIPDGISSLAIEVRDEEGPVLELKCTLDVARVPASAFI